MSDMHDDDNAEALADEKKVESAMADSKMASLFDIRLVVGGVLAIYGAILTVMGIVDNSKAVQKAAGIRINLWTGLAMLALGVLFLLWMKWRPLRPQDLHSEDEPYDKTEAGRDERVVTDDGRTRTQQPG